MQWERHSVVFSLQQYGGSTKCRGVSLGRASVTWCWNLLCLRCALEHCSFMCKLKCAWVAAAAPSFISSASPWSSEDTKHSVSAVELSYLENPLPDSCPHYCPELPQCGLWAPSRMEGSWPSHWGSASALTKGKLETSFHSLSPGHCSGDCSCF